MRFKESSVKAEEGERSASTWLFCAASGSGSCGALALPLLPLLLLLLLLLLKESTARLACIVAGEGGAEGEGGGWLAGLALMCAVEARAVLSLSSCVGEAKRAS